MQHMPYCIYSCLPEDEPKSFETCRRQRKLNINLETKIESEREAGHHRHHKEEMTTAVWPRQKDVRGENSKINYGMDLSQ